MPEQIENRMVVDSEWNEVEYGIKLNQTRLQRERAAYEDVEYGKDNE